MIDREPLSADARSWVSFLEEDLRERLDTVPQVETSLRREHTSAKSAGRTADSWAAWRDAAITQGAVGWVLGAVFVRFLEDNRLLDGPRLGSDAWIAGPGERLAQARDRQLLFFRERPIETDREYLLHVFTQVARLPGAEEVFDRAHQPLWRLGPTGPGATRLLDALRSTDPETGALRHDFTDPAWDTRFLGDLYQDLSEDARKRFALLQTPEFVESFLLDLTLEPAISTFGLDDTDVLDPTCGSGHFLLGAFERLVERRRDAEPETNAALLVERALRQVAGVDVNPFAVAIARFRLLIAALRACGSESLDGAFLFPLQVACGDSLLHGPRFMTSGEEATVGRGQRTLEFAEDPLAHVYETEDAEQLREILV